MRAASIPAVLGAIVLCVGPVALPAQTPTPSSTFRASADLVSVDVSVRRNGRPVTGLSAADFEVLDNGVPQSVVDMSYGKLPIDVTIALDVSSSVTGTVLEQLRRSVQQLATDLGSGDRLKLMTFNMRVRRVVDFSDHADDTTTSRAFASIRPSGSTAIFDTIAVALATPVVPDRRHLVMVFSDGDDSASVTDVGTLIDLARRTTPTLGLVLPLTLPASDADSTASTNLVRFQPGSTPMSRREVYATLAKETGGVVVSEPPTRDLGGTFRRVLEEFRSSYVLHFSPTNVPRAGVHTLAVRVTKAGAYDVRARSGYAWK